MKWEGDYTRDIAVTVVLVDDVEVHWDRASQRCI